MLDKLLGRSGAGGNSPRLPNRRLRIERLESRTLPSVTATLSPTGVLTINGDASRDYIRVQNESGQIVGESFLQDIGQFSLTSVKSIIINAGSGKGTTVIVDPSVTVPTMINGGNGGDVLEGGGGPTSLLGGTGNDKLIAGPGTTTLDGDGGANHLEDVKPNDTANVGPQDTISYALPVIVPAPVPDLELSTTEVQNLLDRAAASNANQSAIIVIVDRGGRILGVRVESGVSPLITGNQQTLDFAIDGAVAEARTAAFFASNQAPLTSRTIQDLSQSTITQREVESNPSITDPNSTVAGPGFVAPIEIGGHFPPGINDTPQVDLYDIQATNRDSTFQQTPTGPVKLPSRFNISPQYIPNVQSSPLTSNLTSLFNVAPSDYLNPPDSYGFVINPADTTAVGRGIGTLPGGIPIYKDDPNNPSVATQLVGGIGVFFPGTTGYADEENSSLGSNYDPSKPDLSLEAEAMAFAAVGGAPGLGLPINAINGVPVLPEIQALPLNPAAERIDLVGITLDIIGAEGLNGPADVFNRFQKLEVGGSANGTDERVTPNPAVTLLSGTAIPDGWLVTPHDGVGITAAEVTQIVQNGIAQANLTRAAIRLPLNSTTKMVFAVSDLEGNIVGLYRMPDATVFSISVAVAKSRNTAYYNNATQLQAADELPGVAPGTALTNRSFRYLAEPHFPEGIDNASQGPFSILNDGGTNPVTGLNVGAPLPAKDFTSVQGHNAFNPDTNFHDPFNPLNQDGIVFFPGSSGLYSGSTLIGGFGVSGDGVDQDDVVTTGGDVGFEAPLGQRIDQVFVKGIRVPYQKFNRNPEGGIVDTGAD